ncbi:MEDS domain-containing protein [Lentzea sp. NPDC005914]|uniref:MEDS domain-containing protein n=1 Tax=Lentzea sp. NPDC005914 TaxID=3154572 RepID=UPI0033DB8F6C
MSATFDGVTLDVHAHLCVFHHGRDERDSLLVPFLRDGLRRGEACQYFVSAGESDDAVSSLDGPDPRLVVHEPKGGHLRGDTLASEAMLADLDDWAARSGTICRVAGDMGWVEEFLQPAGQMDALFQHELNAEMWVRTRPVYVLCFYDLGVFGGDVVVAMVKAHSQIWMGGVLIHNPYHQRAPV